MKIAGKILWGLFVCLLLVSAAYGEEKYICIAEKTTGFRYDEQKKEWQRAFFKTDNKYILSKCPGSDCAYQLVGIGEKNPISTCKETFNSAGYIFCSMQAEFKFNKHNGRFLLVHSLGYYNVSPGVYTDKSSPTPFMEIGKCSPF